MVQILGKGRVKVGGCGWKEVNGRGGKGRQWGRKVGRGGGVRGRGMG